MSTENAARGSIRSLWVKRAHGGPMDARETATLAAGRGIEGNADQGTRRQVTFLDWEHWQRVQERLGAEIDPSVRRANVLLSGIPLAGTRGRILRIGATRVRILGETRPCELMDAMHPGLQEALRPDWGGGAFGEILEGGTIRVGDAAGWEAPAQDAEHATGLP